MSEDRTERTFINTDKTVVALVGIDLNNACLVSDRVSRTDLDTLLALGTETDLVLARSRKLTRYADSRLLGIVFLEVVERAYQLTRLAPCTS